MPLPNHGSVRQVRHHAESSVFTQYLMTGKVLGWMLQSAGFEFLYYYGVMSPRQKKKTIEDFNTDPRKKIMVT